MAKPKIYCTHQLFEDARQILDSNCEAEYWVNSERPPREEVLRRVKETDRSIALLETALAADPGSRGTRQQLAEALYEKGDYAGAEKHYKVLLQTPAPRQTAP